MTGGPWWTEMEGCNGGEVKTRAFSWQSNSRRTTLHPLFPLHLDFRWPTLCWVVTLETALRVFIKRDCGDVEKRSSRQDVVHDKESTHGGRAERLSSLTTTWCHRHLSPCSRCWFLFKLDLHDSFWPQLEMFWFSLIWGLSRAAYLRRRGSESLSLVQHSCPLPSGSSQLFFSCNLRQSLASANEEKVNSIALYDGFEADDSHFISLIPII